MMSERSERREEIKLILEYAKLSLSLAGVILIVLAVLQWRTSTIANTEADYQRIVLEWLNQKKVFVDKPELRPYFEEGKSLTPDDPSKQLVLAVADLRLDAADAILTYADFRGESEDILGWKNEFIHAFRMSPVMCARIAEVENQYGLIRPIARVGCALQAK